MRFPYQPEEGGGCIGICAVASFTIVMLALMVEALS